jgi:uncharacterized iron-regulated membrane protein
MPVISRPSPKVAAREDATLRPIDELVASAQARYGGMPVRNVRFPGGHGRVVTVFVKADTRPRASNQIWFDGYTGQALGTYEAEAVPSGNVLFDWMLPIHSGQAFGLLGRLLFLLAALTLPGLAITGWLQWYKRTQMLREARRSQSMNGEAARP